MRKITYTLPGSDNLALSVNGVPVMAKGGDWGMDEAMKRIPRERLEAQIRMHQLANYTMIRNWVGQSTSEDFYELCDQYGLLVWDEFFQPNPSDGPNPDECRALSGQRAGENSALPQPSLHRALVRPQRGRSARRRSAMASRSLSASWTRTGSTSPIRPTAAGVSSGGPYHWRAPREFYTLRARHSRPEIGSMSVPTLEADSRA